jgi:hypothetical protein
MSSQEQFRESMIRLLIEEQLTLDSFIRKALKYGVSVIPPETIVTAECRVDFSRFFPNISNGKVIGGTFG